MRRPLLAALLSLFLALPAAAQALRIGIFDSRAVALAWYNSPGGRKDLGGLHEELRHAKERRDTERVKEIEALGPARQQLMHQQVFSNGSISNFLPALATTLETVAKEKGVAVIVSKWEIAWKDPAFEYVDVTDALIAAMKPDAKVQRWLADMKSKEPLPLAEALAIRD
jgi:Skp family chaperone for outer membrane proteins